MAGGPAGPGSRPPDPRSAHGRSGPDDLPATGGPGDPSSGVRGVILPAAARGAAAAVAGVAAMTAAEKLEQRVTRRPDSYVPAHTLGRLLGLSRPDADAWPRNLLMHYANGVLLGAVRGVISAANGPRAAALHA